jgi:hypothetical protein
LAAQTALVASYSTALPGSVGRLEGSGDGASLSKSSSDPDEYSEPSSESEPVCDSGEDVESNVDSPWEAGEDVEMREPDDLLMHLFSFFNKDARAGFQGPSPFSSISLALHLNGS